MKIYIIEKISVYFLFCKFIIFFSIPTNKKSSKKKEEETNIKYNNLFAR